MSALKQVQAKATTANSAAPEEHLQKKRQEPSFAEEEDVGFVKDASPSVHETLQRPGEPLTPETREFFEPRFGHDFGKVRLHTDAQAARSAEDVRANAYTVGSDIVFNKGAYQPGSPQGRKLLAHELMHVVQQVHAPWQGGIVQQGGLLMRQAKAQEFPGFSQGQYDSCGAASLVSALLIWDKERKDPASPNTILIQACNTILVYLDDHKRDLIPKFSKERLQGGGFADGQSFFDERVRQVTNMRDAAKAPGGQLSQTLYEELGYSLYAIYKSTDQPGLENFNIHKLQESLGLSTEKKQQGTGQDKSNEGQTFDEVMDLLGGLQPGQAAQVSWYSRGAIQPDGGYSYNRHVFLVGRFIRDKGPWYFSNQGTKPKATEFEEATLGDLKTAIKKDTDRKGFGIVTGGIPVNADHNILAMPNPPGTVLILGDQKGLDIQAGNAIIIPGQFLAEVDETYLHSGDKIIALGFVGRTYDLIDAQKVLNGAGASTGGVIVEDPRGLYNIFKTSLVNEYNVDAKKIDVSDSQKGVLYPPDKRFYSVYLQLRSATRTGSFFKVYKI